MKGVGAAWLGGAAAVIATVLAVSGQPPIVRMLAIIAVLFVSMKAIVAAESEPLAFRQWLAFNLWFGMRPAIFRDLDGIPRPAAREHAARGVRNLAAGALLLAFARAAAMALPLTAARVVATPVMLVALSLMLHFGVFELAAAFWRTRGVAAEPLFRDPLRATSLSDFWSRRWNVGFAEMLAVTVNRPLRRPAGPSAALLASFVVSGLFHELAISVPARAGYGLPTLYFTLHGLLVLAEKRGWLRPSRPLTLAALIVPLPLCFHLPFLRAVVWPMVGLG